MVSCRTTNGETKLVYLTDRIGVPLLPATEMDGQVDELQQISANWNGRSYVMNALLVSDAQGLILIAMGDMGQQLFEISYSDGPPELAGGIGTGQIDAAYVVMDLQLAYYKAASLRKHLASRGLTFTENVEGSDITRKVEEEGDVIISIRISDSNIEISNSLRSYRYSVIRKQFNG